MKIKDIIETLESYAPLAYQESWDNSGFQLGDKESECTGVLICLDVTPEIIDEAVKKGCNLVVSHHPLFFKGIKQLTGDTLSQQIAINAIKSDVAVYSSHTASDSTPNGVSYILAQKLGITPEHTLSDSLGESGLGVIGNLNVAMTPKDFCRQVKAALGCKALRTTKVSDDKPIRRVAVCGGAGGEFISNALKNRADAYVTGDVRYHDFVDYRDKFLIIDAGHYETEAPIKAKFAQVIQDAFPALSVNCTELEDNPVDYQ